MTLPTYSMGRASFPQMYEQALVGPLFQPWVDGLLDRVGLAAGDRVLDVACGTGIVARVAKQRLSDSGRVVGVDLSPEMLAVASAIAPDIEWRAGNAGALPVRDDEHFDVVVCQQGLQFFPDRTAAVREMRRVMAPDGRLAIATWRAIETFPLLRALNELAERHVGPILDQRYSFGNAAALETLLADAGFRDVRLETMTRTIRFADGGESFVRLNAMALVGMSAGAAAMTEEERAHAAVLITTDSTSVLSAYADAEGLAFELSTNVATARA